MVFVLRIAPGMAWARTGALVLSLAGLLGACASVAPAGPAATRFTVGEAAPVAGPGPVHPNNPSGGRYKVGAPYQQFGLWYVPAEQPNYDETGLASWYGDAFDGRRTANGEVFDMHAVSAAHATLPMPCLVEVTNLDNGRKLVVRLNDRGPYHPGRIIDLSHAGAEQLGYAIKGTTRVRVRYVGPAPLDGVDARQSYASQAIEPPAPIRPFVEPPALLSPAAMAGGYSVQAGAYASRSNAERAASRLAAAGAARVTPISRSGGVLYRVVLGPWSDRESADGVRSRIAALGFGDARVSEGS